MIKDKIKIVEKYENKHFQKAQKSISYWAEKLLARLRDGSNIKINDLKRDVQELNGLVYIIQHIRDSLKSYIKSRLASAICPYIRECPYFSWEKMDCIDKRCIYYIGNPDKNK